jgi:hypothetical protein
MSLVLPIQRLEQYTCRFPNEVLMVNAQINGEDDYVVVFRGFSSSLVKPTAADPEVPVLPAEAVIASIDRLQGPYTPDNPQYIEPAIAWPEFRDRLTQMGL